MHSIVILETVTFKGAEAQWNAITKEADWDIEFMSVHFAKLR